MGKTEVFYKQLYIHPSDQYNKTQSGAVYGLETEEMFMKNPAHIVLKKNAEKHILRRYPWVLSEHIAEIKDYKYSGQPCLIHSHDMRILASGYCNQKSSITGRILSFNGEDISPAMLKDRIKDALSLRRRFINRSTTAYRLINSEGDFLPGLIVDVYGDVLVAQFRTAGMDCLKDEIVKALIAVMKPASIVERSDLPAREKEGLVQKKDVIWGDLPDSTVKISENGHFFLVDVMEGQKTGFFLDQRENRRILGDMAAGKTVCNCFCYTGGFSVYAQKKGARKVVSVDISEKALQCAKNNIEANDLKESELIKANVFDYLRKDSEKYDIVILDPPKFASSKKTLSKALKGYKDINRIGFQKVNPGGLLFTFSCSRVVTAEVFLKVIADAAVESRREVQVIKKLEPGPDHPQNIFHEESDYLKGYICRVL